MIVPASIPSNTTLKKYGLTEHEWLWILEKQGYLCPICGKVPNVSKKTGKRRWVIDHEHRKNWKNLSDEQRKATVRGITCWFCNRNFLAKGITIEKAQNIVKYLQNYQSRTTK